MFYDVTNFYYESDCDDADTLLECGTVEKGLRKRGVSKEERKAPIVQMGMIMDKAGSAFCGF